jgi:hypothetical protein
MVQHVEIDEDDFAAAARVLWVVNKAVPANFPSARDFQQHLIDEAHRKAKIAGCDWYSTYGYMLSFSCGEDHVSVAISLTAGVVEGFLKSSGWLKPAADGVAA